MKRRSPFARFEAALASERKAARLAEQAVDPDPVLPRKRTRPRHQAISVNVNPRVTARAALVAAKEGLTTEAVVQQWLIDAAAEREAVKPEHPGIELALKIAVGPHGISVNLAEEVQRRASALGLDPGELIALFIHQGLKEARQ